MPEGNRGNLEIHRPNTHPLLSAVGCTWTFARVRRFESTSQKTDSAPGMCEVLWVGSAPILVDKQSIADEIPAAS